MYLAFQVGVFRAEARITVFWLVLCHVDDLFLVLHLVLVGLFLSSRHLLCGVRQPTGQPQVVQDQHGHEQRHHGHYA